jgi:hypothetical protein
MKILSKLYADIFYDNTTSGLTADTIKAALDELNLKKADINVLSSNLILYPTTATADVTGYQKMVTSPTDADYNTTAVDIPTGAINSDDQLLASLVSEAGLIVGNPGVFNINTVGRIRKTDGNENRLATFYYKVFKRNAEGTEALIATSNNTKPVSNTDYSEFNSTSILSGVEFIATDRIVIKYYGSPSGVSGGEFEFEFGGNTPVRTLIPVPINVIPTATASDITVDASGFSGALSASDTNLQAALETLDAIDGTGIAYDNSTTNLIATNMQEAIDALYQLLFPEIASFDGGAPSSTNFVYSLDGGDPDGEDQTLSADGGDPLGPTVDGGDS